MHALKVYARAMGVLRHDRRIAIMLAVANLFVAGLQFLDPVLFGRVIQMLSNSDTLSSSALWTQATGLLGVWALVGLLGIVANVVSAVYSERLAHRNRLKAMSGFFSHVLHLPLSFHGEAHSGRMMKIMLSGTDALFGMWLSFFREQLSTVIATAVLLPLTLFLNWRLALSLILLVAVNCLLTVLVIRKTEAGQVKAQGAQMALAGTAQDALANVMVVQSFTRLAAETRIFGEIVEQVIRHQFPVLNWWAVVNVMTRAASTIAVISIVVIGTYLHAEGQASVGEIVSIHGAGQPC